MYKRYCNLRDAKKVKDSDISRATGIVSSTFSDWKKGKSSPNAEKLLKIAAYLDVSMEYLMTGKERNVSDEDAYLDAKISADSELKKAIEIYFTLDDRKKRHILDLIYLLAEGAVALSN